MSAANDPPAGVTLPDKKPRRRQPASIDWETIEDEKLLALRICDLPIRLEGSGIEERIEKVHGELAARGIAFHPPVYLADEWFSPEGDPVIGIPFYLAHPRLARLERRMMLDAEGDTATEFLKLLRHEVGHALCHAYRLHRRPLYIRTFGRSSEDYPEGFRPRPYSRQYVQHLDDWYAQTHPDEDYAETFAVWLTPNLDWRRRYKGWKALKKLEALDRMMKTLVAATPKKKTGERMARLSTLRCSLATYYKRKRKAFAQDFPDFFDRDLADIFWGDPNGRSEPASRFLRRNRRLLVRTISAWTAERRFTINGLVSKFADRSQELGLRIGAPETETLTETTACLTAMASNYFLTGKFKRPR